MAGLTASVPAPLRPLAVKLRDVVRTLSKPSLDRILSVVDRQGRIEPRVMSFVLQKGETVPCPIRITNHGNSIWSSTGIYPLVLSLRWLSARKEPLDVATMRVPLPTPVYPGESVEVPVSLIAPDFLGHCLVEAMLQQDGGAVPPEQGCKPVLIEAQITGRYADDIDYYKAYATADLTQDYWTVVGPKSKDEFDKLAQAKLQLLLEVGATPDACILDVGCGTGQLAVALETFLSEKGCYFGTDIGPEAITFCQQQFKRSNFRFAQNQMTSIPIEREQFTHVTFFSVFTHTFPDETALLLAEAKRLLAANGTIIGDVFTSSIVDRCSGNRGMMELNREHFLRLVQLAGLTAQVMHATPWGTYCQREIFSFTHRVGANL